MSQIKTEIEQNMAEPVMTGTGITANFRFPVEFVGFQGHFPTTRVLPGACQIQCVLSAVEQVLKRGVILKQIVLAKYFAPVFPDDSILCTVSGLSDSGAECVCKGRMTRGEEKIADFKLQIAFGDAL